MLQELNVGDLASYMCGIAGSVGRNITLSSLLGAAKVLHHRGPDGHGYLLDKPCGLVHTRLAVLDLSPAGHQPMVDPDTGVAIVLNGEIYNYLELKANLVRPWRSNTDTEVILALYLARGLSAMVDLRGMFALAIWDPRDQSLHLVRDRFGIKPLYVWQDGNRGLVFGSEVKAMIELGAPSHPDKVTIRRYLESGALADGLDTFFQGIKAVAPGVILTWIDGCTTTLRYWDLADAVATRTWSEQSETEIQERVWARLRESIKLHLVSDVPVGLALSAGLDSQLLANLMTRENIGEVHGFTFGFDEVDYDESRQVRETKYGIKVRQHVLITQPSDLLKELDEAVRLFEAPLGGLGTFSVYRLMRLAKECGVPVLLSGEGADEVFGGYKAYFFAYLRGLWHEGRLGELSKEAEAWKHLTGEDLTLDSKGFLSNITAYMGGVKAPDGTSLGGKAFLGQAFADDGDSQAASAGIYIPDLGDSPFRKAMLEDLFSLKLPKLLMFQDRAAMSHGIETRVPFLDHELVADVYALPPRFLIGEGVTKRLPKMLIKRFVGVDHTQTVKRFVNAPQREWIKGPLYDTVLSRLKGGVLDRGRWVDIPAFEEAYSRYKKSPELGNSFFVWKMLNLEAFMQAYFSAPPAHSR